MTFSRFPWVIAQPGGQKRWHDLGDSMVNTRRISLAQRDFFGATNSWGMWFFLAFDMGMYQYLLIPFFWGWTSIYQLFWCSPGVQGFWHTNISVPEAFDIWKPALSSRFTPTPLLNKRLRGPEIAKRLIHAEPWWKTRFWGDLRFHDIPWIPMAHDIPFCPTISYIIIYTYHIYIYILYIYHIYIYTYIYICITLLHPTCYPIIWGSLGAPLDSGVHSADGCGAHGKYVEEIIGVSWGDTVVKPRINPMVTWKTWWYLWE